MGNVKKLSFVDLKRSVESLESQGKVWEIWRLPLVATLL